MSKGSNPGAAQRVSQVEGLKVSATYKKNVTTTSQTFESLIGSALPDNVGCVEVSNESGGTIVFNNGAAVSGTHAEIVDGKSYPFYGRKTDIDEIQLIAGSSLAVSIIVYTTI